MPELVASDNTRWPLKAEGSIVGRRSGGDVSFRPDVDLADIEGGRTVSRQHARVFLRDGQWHIKVEPTTTNVTIVGGKPLTQNQEAPLAGGDEIQLGKVVVMFQEGGAIVPEAQAGPAATTAELRGEDRVIPLAAHEDAELTLGRHSEDGTYRPDVDLADLPYGRTVSRRHGRLIYRMERWFLRVEAEVTNPTVLEGKALGLGEEVPLSDGQRLQLGRTIVTFHQLARIPAVGPEQIELIVDRSHLTVEAGGEAEAEVTLINHTGHVDWFRVELQGLPSSWYKIVLPDGTVGAPAQVRLFHTPAHVTPSADALAQIKIVYSPPKDSQSWAGVHPIVVCATTQGEPQARRTVTGQLTVAPFEDLVVVLQPEEITSTQGEYSVELSNNGNALASVKLEIDGDGLVHVCERSDVQLSNGARDLVKIKAKVKKRHWLGAQRLYNFTVAAKAGDVEEVRRARLMVPPRVPIWLQTGYRRIHSALLPFVILLGVLAIAWTVLRPPDVNDFKAEPASIVAGKPVTLAWSLNRADGVTIEPASGTEVLTVQDGTLVVTPTVSTRYTLNARNRFGIQSSRTVNVEVKPAPVLAKILSFTASPERIRKEGDPVTLRWQTDGATKVTVEPAAEVQDPRASGEATVRPSKNNATYKLVATNDAGSVDQTKTIIVEPPQVTSFMAAPESVIQGGEVRLRWSAQGFTKLSIKANKGEIVQGKQEVELAASATDQAVRPMEDTEYTLTATNAGGAESKTVTVKVSAMRVAFFRAEPQGIAKGESTMLTWKVDGASAVTIQPGVGAVALEQTSALVKPGEDTEYILTATGADGKQIEANAKVTVGLGPAKVDLFTAAPSVISKGEQATLTYSVQNGKRITIKASDGRVLRDVAVGQPSVTGTLSDAPGQTTTYILTVSNDSGQATQAASVEVRQPAPPSPVP